MEIFTPTVKPKEELVEWRGVMWPKNMPLHQRHLYLWKKHKEYPYSTADFLNPISEHVLEAGRMLFTPKQLVIHPWFEDMCESYTMNEATLWWGAASCGKSHCMGWLFLMDYITDPNDTFIMLASTSKPMLELRSYASVVEYLGFLKANRKLTVPFKYTRQSMTVGPDHYDPDNPQSAKGIIRGVAVCEGSQAEARAKLQGVHLKYVRLGADELTAMREAILEARNNLAVCKDFKFVGAANPESIYDICGQVSEPANGWDSVGLETKSWRTSRDWEVLRFDAYDSPGLKDPEAYPFLPTQQTVERILRENEGNEDAPAVWTFLRAMTPPQGLEKTVLSETMITAYNMSDDGVVWKTTPTKIAGFDPAFTSDGDNPVLVIANVGYDQDGTLLLKYEDVHYLKIEASSERPVLEQLVDQLQEILDAEDIPNNMVGVDDSGSQSVADMLEIRRGLGVYRCNFASRAPDLAVSVANDAPAHSRYRNCVTWMYYLLPEYGQRKQIRGLPKEAARQFCMRQVVKLKPLALEPKVDFKKRIHGRSPDEADACAICAGLARERLGFVPGTTEWTPGGQVIEAVQDFEFQAMAKTFNNLMTEYA